MQALHRPTDRHDPRRGADRLWVGRATAAVPLVCALGLAACGGQTVGGESEGSGTLSLEEATIRGIHDAFAAGTLACVQLVEYCLRRVEAYDDQGPALNVGQRLQKFDRIGGGREPGGCDEITPPLASL